MLSIDNIDSDSVQHMATTCLYDLGAVKNPTCCLIIFFFSEINSKKAPKALNWHCKIEFYSLVDFIVFLFLLYRNYFHPQLLPKKQVATAAADLGSVYVHSD